MISPREGFVKASFVLLVLLVGISSAIDLQAQTPRTVTLTVVGRGGGATPPPVGDYRWLLEEDRTIHTPPGTATANDLAVNFHASYMPVADKGEGTAGTPRSITLPDSTKHYYVSVLPKTPGSYALGGTNISPTETAVTVYVNKQPIPTAQITVLVYNDNAPLNNAPEIPEEVGLPGFNIMVEDAGGRYGASAGELVKDAFDNNLGTEYFSCTDPIQASNTVNCVANPTQYQLDVDGAPIYKSWHPLITGPDGTITIKNLGPAKYGITAIPPIGSKWQQTHTIEGTKIIDAWVKANEPPFFAEFGPPGWHVFIGFTRPHNTVSNAVTGKATIEGCVVNNHLSRPPNYDFYDGAAFEHTTPWVGLNNNAGTPGLSQSVYAERTADGCFTIPLVPPGTYQLAIWDDALDVVFASHLVTVNPDGSCIGGCNLGSVPVFQWFTSTHHYVFEDNGCPNGLGGFAGIPGNGFREACEPGILEQAVNLRWRDGTINQTAPTDLDGFVPFDEVFPFFHWLVAEVDFLRFKPTGVSVVVDNGGPINPADPWTFGGILNPQPQCSGPYDPNTETCALGQELINPNTGNNKVRTEVGPVLLEGFQGFLGQTSVFAWGKQAYGPTENGGISGIVFYDSTRAEDDPKNNGPELWQPGIPGVTVQLYSVASPGVKGVLLAATTTDSWDNGKPTGCQGETFTYNLHNAAGLPTGSITPDCYDGLRNWNQVRPGVFDGGYAFTQCSLLGGVCVAPGTAGSAPGPIAPGQYIVQVVPPKGPTGQLTYEVVKEEDKNVDFGDSYVPSPLALPWECVGVPADLPGYGYSATVPQYLTLFPGVETANKFAPRKLCNAKQISLTNGSQVGADFFLFTEVPIAGHFVGMILDDTQNEFDPTSPNFGEKYAPPWMPVAIRDWTGQEIGRVYADKYGRYNGLLPSTYTANSPKPSGMDPGMFVTCMNARNKPNGSGGFTVDPWHNTSYSEFCYTFQYMPGTTTYLDTPVIPVAAFAGPNQKQLDCELPDKTPKVMQVSVAANGFGGGPYATTTGQVVTIGAVGYRDIPNPEYCPGPPFTTADACPTVNTTASITRDFGFGPPVGGTITVGGVPITTGFTWTNLQITFSLPAAVGNGVHQIVIRRGDSGRSTVASASLEVRRNQQPTVLTVAPPPADGPCPAQFCSIQAAIDASTTGNNLILVKPGTYQEMVIMHKPVRLQGWGEDVTTIDAVNVPQDKKLIWRQKIESLVNTGAVLPLPGQEVAFGGLEPPLFFAEEGAGVFVAGNRSGNSGIDWNGFAPRIDGLAITGADNGGGIVVNGRVQGLTISNNRIVNNSGFFSGGVRLGHSNLVDPGTLTYTDALNDNIVIRNNQITQNGGFGGAGGGVSICTGADNYQVTGNFICGNFQAGDGGGVGHLGLSRNGVISNNTIIFNENFNQGTNVQGGGLFIAGQPALAGQTPQGSGNVTVNANLILGNMAGAGDGGGVRLQNINGSPQNYTVSLTNNMITNNVAGMAGGGISMADAGNADILYNTVARNDSTATSGQAFSAGIPNQSNAQVAGIVKTGAGTPRVRNNIIWGNRSFFFQVGAGPGPDFTPTYTLVPAAPPIQDLGSGISATYSLFTNSTPGTGNLFGNPQFVQPYANGVGGTTVLQPEFTTTLTPPPAFDEGGNFIRPRFGPLSLTFRTAPGNPLVFGNYHILPTSPAVNTANGLLGVNADFDGDSRLLNPPDRGADERTP